MNHVDLVVADQLLSVFGVKGDIRLAVILLELDLSPKQAAGIVDLLDGHRGRHHHRLAVNVKQARIVQDGTELYWRALGWGGKGKSGRQRRRTCSSQQLPARYCHDILHMSAVKGIKLFRIPFGYARLGIDASTG